MRAPVRQAAWLSLVTLLCAAPAAAQFKPKLPNPLKKSPAARTAPAPIFNDRLLEITDARVDQMIKGFGAESAALAATDGKQAELQRAYEEENKAYPAKLRDYEQKQQQWNACQEREVKPVQAKQEKSIEQTQREVTGGDQAAFEAKMADVKARMQAAQAKGDMAEVMRLADSLNRNIGMKTEAVANTASAEMQKATSKCGAEPVRPEPPTPPANSGPNLDAEGAKAAGLTQEQYALLKERIRYAVREDGEVELNSSQWAFSQGEIDTLKKRGSNLYQAFAPLQQRGH